MSSLQDAIPSHLLAVAARDIRTVRWRVLVSLVVNWVVLLALASSIQSAAAGAIAGALVGTSMAAIGHDAIHASGSRAPTGMWRAILMGMVPIGFFSTTWWKYKHDSHHIFTNSATEDDDLTVLLRVNQTQTHRTWHRFQRGYVFIILPWVYVAFGIKAVRYAFAHNPECVTARARISRAWTVLEELFLTPVVLAVIASGLGLTKSEIAMLLGSAWLASGAVWSLMFLPTHYVSGMVGTFSTNGAGVDAVGQLRSAVDFSTSSRSVRLLTGGLNLHIEHHLFPWLPSWRYPPLVPYVRDWAVANGHTITQFDGYRAAFCSWWSNIGVLAKQDQAPTERFIDV